jgi:hypothetical protein
MPLDDAVALLSDMADLKSGKSGDSESRTMKVRRPGKS